MNASRAIGHLLPPGDATRPSNRDRVRFLLVIVVPWLVLYEATVLLQEPGRAFEIPLDDRLPLWPWTVLVYWSSYVTVPIAPWFARTQGELRKLTLTAGLATLIVFPVFWLVPSSAPRPELEDDSVAAGLLLWERGAYAAVAAFPSFHVIWAVLVAQVYRPQWTGVAYVAAVSISCLTTRQHYIADVIAALVLSTVLVWPRETLAVLRAGIRLVVPRVSR